MPNFSFNGKYHNKLINNRVPDYGIANQDGCIVMREINLSLNSLFDSLKGNITDAFSLDPLYSAKVEMYFSDTTIQVVQSNAEGDFSVLNNKRIIGIQVTYLGYRSLYINLKRMKMLN